MEVRPELFGRCPHRRKFVLSYRNCKYSAGPSCERAVWGYTEPRRQNLYNNLTYLYPEANIWMTGHSLGGALASLLGVTFGAPTLAIESPGEKMAANRLHLPTPVCGTPFSEVQVQ